jgi:hypothetical protein
MRHNRGLYRFTRCRHCSRFLYIGERRAKLGLSRGPFAVFPHMSTGILDLDSLWTAGRKGVQDMLYSETNSIEWKSSDKSAPKGLTSS